MNAPLIPSVSSRSVSFRRTLEPVKRVGLIWIFENYISITNGNTVAMHKSDLTTLLRKKY